jgi:hypothetical protein
VARPQIDPKRKNGVPGYTHVVVWGIWSMAEDEIRIRIGYQPENQTNIGWTGYRLTDSGQVNAKYQDG